MTAAEVKRAMWLTPIYVGTAVIAGLTRIAAGAIQETMPLWLALLVAVVCIAPATWITIRTRRRYRARLTQLSDPITSSPPLPERLPPLPLRVRMWLIGAPLLVVLSLVLVASGRGAGNTCVTQGIGVAAAREGTCREGQTLFGGGVTFNVVDAGHVLHMPGYDAQLLATTTQTTMVLNTGSQRALYPNGVGTLICLKLAITNRGSTPLAFDPGGADVRLLLQTPQPSGAYWTQDKPSAMGEPGASLATLPPIQPGDTAEGWVAFVTPPWAPRTLNAPATDLELLVPSNDGGTPPSKDYVGEIRLWKAGNAAGEKALSHQSTG